MPQLGFWEMIAQATVVVQAVLALLVGMSLASWSIIFYKLLAIRKAKAKAATDLETFQEAKDLRAAVRSIGRAKVSPTYRMAALGVDELNRLEESGSSTCEMAIVMDNLQRALTIGAGEQLSKLAASLSFLATCANAAPFIGLFGTVWGIMHSFHSIGQMKTASLAVVAPGISEALVATAIGLAVAIPATIFYNYFQGLLSEVETVLSNFSAAFLNRVQRELPGLDGARTKKDIRKTTMKPQGEED